MTTIEPGVVERLQGLEAEAIAWLGTKIADAQSRVADCAKEATFFRNHEFADTWAPNAEKWEQDGRKAAHDLEIYEALAAIAADRDEWRTQHENLLSVRQSDLALLAQQQARIGEMEGALTKLLDSSGDRGRYHAMEYADAVDAAEAALAKEPT